MDAPLCRACNTRHWGNCRAEKKVASKMKEVIHQSIINSSKKVEYECPVCAERKLKQREATKRYRAKKKEER
jgi:predicted RNA-binding Zn-ribbon protein involved in translation (DUF1610 family)